MKLIGDPKDGRVKMISLDRKELCDLVRRWADEKDVKLSTVFEVELRLTESDSIKQEYEL